MSLYKKKNFIPYLILTLLIILLLLSYFFINNFEKNKKLALQPISINLLTSVHPNLNWHFKPVKTKIYIRPGEVTTVEYIVENLGDIESTGIATFVYFPNNFGDYISKINCFCYDAQTLKPKEKNKFILVLLIDPEVTKNNKTKSVKEATIQFTFFDYKEYKKNKT